MADEITIQSTLQINKVTGGLPPLKHGITATKVDQTNKQKVSLTISCTTTTTAIDLSDLTAVGYVYLENIGDTNDAIVLANNGTNDAEFAVVGPGIGYPVQLSTNSTYVAKSAASTTTLIVEAYAK